MGIMIDIFATHRPLIALCFILAGAILLVVGLIGARARKRLDPVPNHAVPPVTNTVFDVSEIREAEATPPTYGGSRVETGSTTVTGSQRRRLTTSSGR